MDYSIETAPLEALQCDCMIVGVYQDLQLCPSATVLNASTQGLINAIVRRGDLSGKNGETALISVIPGSKIGSILLVGLGENKPLSGKNYKKALIAAINSLKKPYIKTVVCCLAECAVEGRDWQWKTRHIIEVFSDAAYQYTQTKSDKETESKLEKTAIFAPEAEFAATHSGMLQGKAVADGLELTKRLADLPGNLCTPTYLAEQAIELSKKYAELKVKILEESDMAELGMGALLSVSRGSRQPAKLIVIEYQGGEHNAQPIVLIGKGLTFDAGGISLKPVLGMEEMKYDMCGGSTVMGVLLAAAQLRLPLNIVGLIPSSENLPDGDANKPGDIVTSMSGKTIEIINTDAEGRLLLCDTLTYAERYHPELVIDIATLTGACGIALGRVTSGLLGNDDALCNELYEAGEIANDNAWRLPIGEDYQEQLKSNFADMSNSGGKDAGAITGACFLARFAEKFRWAHLDVAATAWRTGPTKGATGRPMLLLSQFIINRAQNI